jgi:hypothetical protein
LLVEAPEGGGSNKPKKIIPSKTGSHGNPRN